VRPWRVSSTFRDLSLLWIGGTAGYDGSVQSSPDWPASSANRYYRDFGLKLSYKGPSAERNAYVEAIGLPGERCIEKLKLPEEGITSQLERFKAGHDDRQSSEWLGGRLFDALFPLSIRESWRRYQDFMLPDSILRLLLDIRHPGLAVIPWEMLHDDGSPLVMSPRHPIVRGRPPRRPVPLGRRDCLRILIVTAAADQHGPSADRAAVLIENTLRQLADTGAVTVEVLESPSKKELTTKVKRSDILHYVGRAEFTRGTGTIALRDAAMGGKELAEILLGGAARLLVLNSGENATRPQVDALMRLAQSALRAGLPGIVAMQGVIGPEPAAEFAAPFYRALADGEQLETCVIKGRRAIAAGRPERAYWAMPALFTDLPDGILWNLVPRSGAHLRSGQPVGGPAVGPLDRPRSPTITVRSSDGLAAVELADSAGGRLSAAQGNLVVTDLKPGFYRARLMTPEGAAVEELIDLEEGEAQDVRLDAPTEPPSKLAGQEGPWGDQLPALGLRSFQEIAGADAGSGLRLILAIEASTGRESGRRLSATSVRLWPETDPIPEPRVQPRLTSPAGGVAEFDVTGQPGPHWLALEMPGSDPVVFALTLLPGRLTVLIVQQDELGEARVLQYMPSLAGDEQVEPASAGERSRAALVRRLELMQRFAMSGQLDYALMNARELLRAGWEEPVAAALSGYLMLRSGDGAEFLTVAGDLMNRLGALSDSHVLVASAMASTGGDDRRVEREFRAALDQGLPMIADGLGLLAGAVDRYGIEHPRVPLLSAVFGAHLPGVLWSAWRPQALTAGAMLISA
jgi:CHAT domain